MYKKKLDDNSSEYLRISDGYCTLVFVINKFMYKIENIRTSMYYTDEHMSTFKNSSKKEFDKAFSECIDFLNKSVKA